MDRIIYDIYCDYKLNSHCIFALAVIICLITIIQVKLIIKNIKNCMIIDVILIINAMRLIDFIFNMVLIKFIGMQSE